MSPDGQHGIRMFPPLQRGHVCKQSSELVALREFENPELEIQANRNHAQGSM